MNKKGLTPPAEFPLWRRALEMDGDDDGRRLGTHLMPLTRALRSRGPESWLHPKSAGFASGEPEFEPWKPH